MPVSLAQAVDEADVEAFTSLAEEDGVEGTSYDEAMQLVLRTPFEALHPALEGLERRRRLSLKPANPHTARQRNVLFGAAPHTGLSSATGAEPRPSFRL